MHKFWRAVFKLYLLTLILTQVNYASELLPVQGVVRDRVNFWKRVYTEITTKEAFLHDKQDVSIVYGKVDLPDTPRKRRRFIKKYKRNVRKQLDSIFKKKFTDLTPEEAKYAMAIPLDRRKDLYGLKRGLRFQYGLRDRYYKGLIRSYQYLDHIKTVFQSLGLPPELVYLPHVESSFNYKAYSKVGAAGIWQFMRSTARRYRLNINYVVDERRDPIKATFAAGKLLRDNYNLLGAWPLAITAYNHGARSLMQAKKKLGTSEIHKIIENYDGRRFGFASKNFYATFMATVEISKDPEKYFPKFKKDSPFVYSALKLQKSLTLSQVEKALGFPLSVLLEYNLALRPRSGLRSFFLPKNFELKVPLVAKEKIVAFQQTLDNLKPEKRNLDESFIHVVSRGDSFFILSKMYKTPVSHIIAANSNVNPRRIHPGMKIVIPGKKTKIGKLVAAKDVAIKVDMKNVPKLIQGKVEKETPTNNAQLFANAMKTVFGEPKPQADFDIPFLDNARTNSVDLSQYELEIKRIAKNQYLIVVETDETLGHFADWGGLRTQSIRSMNGLGRRSSIQLGQKILIPLKDAKLEEFKQNRNLYHTSIQEDFYESFEITGVEDYKVRRGDNLTRILSKEELPFWLFRGMQVAKVDERNLKIGDTLKLPQIKTYQE